MNPLHRMRRAYKFWSEDLPQAKGQNTYLAGVGALLLAMTVVGAIGHQWAFSAVSLGGLALAIYFIGRRISRRPK